MLRRIIHVDLDAVLRLIRNCSTGFSRTRNRFAATIKTMSSVGTNSAGSAGTDVQPLGRRWMRWLPGLNTVRFYQPEWLRRDLVAGLVMTTMLVPVGIAYAEASGLPGINGLYATIVPLLAYALLVPIASWCWGRIPHWQPYTDGCPAALVRPAGPCRRACRNDGLDFWFALHRHWSGTPEAS